jgi:hypothetical protein
VGRYDSGELDQPVEITQPHFPTDSGFAGPNPDARWSSAKLPGPSYAERYKIFMERMLLKKQYDGACFITTHETIKDQTMNYLCVYPELSGAQFLEGLLRHVSAYYFDLPA